MPIIDKSRLDRQFAIVDMIKSLPTAVAFAGIADLLLEEQDRLYDFLHDIETQLNGTCVSCRETLTEDDVELCGVCADRSEQIANLQDMVNRSGVVFGERA